jgi:site-specific recombinase XerC
MPARVDPRRLPKRCYWDGRDRVWYTIHTYPKPRRQRIAGPEATLADLHSILESIAGVDHTCLGYVLAAFHDDVEFRELAPSTRAGYEKQRAIATAFKTKAGTLTSLNVARMSVPMMQVLVNSIAKTTPTKANHLLRYLRRSLAWGVRNGKCNHNPCKGVRQAKERKRRILPEPVAVMAVLQFFQQRAGVTLRRAGAVAPYLWLAMEFAFMCRLRGIEVLTLTDANATTDGVVTNRRKGSRDNCVRWSPRLRAAWDAAIALRESTWARCRTPVPIRAEDRPLLVGIDGKALRKGTFDSAWQHAIKLAIAEGVITAEQRFSLHPLKRRGVTDTVGTRADRKEASGHVTDAMMDVYDFTVPLVNPAGE